MTLSVRLSSLPCHHRQCTATAVARSCQLIGENIKMAIKSCTCKHSNQHNDKRESRQTDGWCDSTVTKLAAMIYSIFAEAISTNRDKDYIQIKRQLSHYWHSDLKQPVIGPAHA